MKATIACRDCGGLGSMPDVCPDRKPGCAVNHQRQCPYCRGRGREVVEAEPITEIRQYKR